jgi:threonine dehydratase
VCMPTLAPLTKVQNCRELGARVIIAGDHIGEAREAAFALAESEGLSYNNGFDVRRKNSLGSAMRANDTPLYPQALALAPRAPTRHSTRT